MTDVEILSDKLIATQAGIITDYKNLMESQRKIIETLNAENTRLKALLYDKVSYAFGDGDSNRAQEGFANDEAKARVYNA